MSAKKTPSSEINAQYAVAIQAIAAKDLQIAELVKEKIDVPAHTRSKRKRYTDKDGNPRHFPEHLERRDTHVKL